MAKYQYGLLKFETGTMDPVTGEVTDWVEEKVYQDTCVIDRPEATKTEHYAQGDPNAKVIRYSRPGTKTIAFSIFDRSAASKVKWLGGTVTTVQSKDMWNEPETPVTSTKKAIRLTFEDGSQAIAPNCSCAARDAWNPNDSDVAVIPVVASVMSTGVAGVSSWRETDA
ncbi:MULTISPECIES: hypothetical protein [Sphingobacterium]|uniref:hypothetical protein n=1 Tax=Sphingobacterium TaxID=28453 RepID=UPI00257F56EF|nr:MULTISPECIES: hypothetical protein [Sphingobacterium]